MKALTFHGKELIKFESVNDPVVIQDTDVIVKVRLSCICGSDLHVYHGRERGIDVGTAMGHEFVGEIVERGEAVRQLNAGDLVMCPFTTNCGECYYCHIGLTCRCERGQLFGWVEEGKGLPGAQAEYVRVPLAESTLMKIPEGVSCEEGLLLGDIFSTGFYCAHQAEVNSKGIYAIVGCGPVGMMTIVGARELGAENIFVIDQVEERLAMGSAFGAIPINLTRQNPLEIIKEHSGGRGADAVMEAVGSNGAGRLAYELVRPGGIISTVGVCTDSDLAFSPAEAYDKNLTFRVGRCPARHLMERLVPVVQEKKYPLTDVISHRMKLDEGAHAYRMFANREDNCLKVLLEVG
ncbi:MAG: alcohol dehydrogenase family protein [Cyclobacteriaceae bacterium]